MRVGRKLPEFGQNRGGIAEFRLGQADVADKAVQVLTSDTMISRSRGSDVRSITDVAATVTSC